MGYERRVYQDCSLVRCIHRYLVSVIIVFIISSVIIVSSVISSVLPIIDRRSRQVVTHNTYQKGMLSLLSLLVVLLVISYQSSTGGVGKWGPQHCQRPALSIGTDPTPSEKGRRVCVRKG